MRLGCHTATTRAISAPVPARVVNRMRKYRMIVTSIATFTIRSGKVPGALRLIRAVERQANREQPGTLVYLAQRRESRPRERLQPMYSKLGPTVEPSLRPDGMAISAWARYLRSYIIGTAFMRRPGSPLKALCSARSNSVYF